MQLPRGIGPGAVAFLALWLLLLVGGRSSFFGDPGTFWHVATGEHILAEGFIATDPYTFTFAGAWWIPAQWLAEVAMALAHHLGGFDALLLGAVTILAAVYAWLAVRLFRTGLHPILVAGVIGLGLGASSSNFHVRPLLFTIACMALTTILLLDVDAGTVPLHRLLLLVPLCVLWTNVHGGVLGGIATVAVTAAGWVAARVIGLRSPVQSWSDAGCLGAVIAGCGLATLVNPYGLDQLRTWQLILGPSFQKIVQEHTPLDPTRVHTWPIFALAALYAFLLLGVPWRDVRVSWLLPLVWLVLTLDRVRHAPLFGVVTLAALASVWPSTRWAAWLSRHRPEYYSPGAERPVPLWAELLLPALAVLTAFALEVAHVPVPVIGAGWARIDPERWPVGLLDVLKHQEPGPGQPNHLFNDYYDGGFVIYYAPGYRVFVDDRNEVFGAEWMEQFIRASHESTAKAIASWEREYGGFDFALTRRGTAFDDHFRHSPAWELVKETGQAAFYRRKEGREGLAR
jgi:hypothetical protein